jgi:hypothetical protein
MRLAASLGPALRLIGAPAFLLAHDLFERDGPPAPALFVITPIDVSPARGPGRSPTPFVVCSGWGAVVSFLIPIGHHGDLWILDPGRYTFGDFLR